MKYKALFSDVDGTLISYDFDSLPSDKVVHAIHKASEKIKVFLVTGRQFGSCEKILEKLQLHNSVLVSNGGASIIDCETKEILYEKFIDEETSKRVIKVLFKHSIEFYCKSDPFIKNLDTINKIDEVKKSYMILSFKTLTHEKVTSIFNDLSDIPNLSLHKDTDDEQIKFGFNITHAEATKLHGIAFLMRKFNLNQEEVIGMGDGYNDFPLLMASGLKIAMGNAVDDLKAIADYVAPSVFDDGAAVAIEKFILSDTSLQ